MAPIALEAEDHARDAAFNKALHGKSAESKAGFRSMLSKDREAQQAASQEYFKHWDNKAANAETEETREARTRFIEFAWPLTNVRSGAKGRICDLDQTLL